MEGLDRSSLYKNILETMEDKEVEIYRLLQLNITILFKIESFFIFRDADNRSIENKAEINALKFKDNYFENISKARDQDLFQENREDFLKFETIFDDENKDVYYYFNALVRTLAKINNSNFKKVYLGDENSKGYPSEKMTRVFLSHAFDDRLYTWALYNYMKKRGIFLYVDWMHSPAYKSGVLIKRNLFEQLEKSQQLLFLRTTNSEFNIKGSGNIRGWCSWELGTFYSLNEWKANNDKFYIQLYNRKNITIKNLQLDGISPLKRISNGRLQ